MTASAHGESGEPQACAGSAEVVITAAEYDALCETVEAFADLRHWAVSRRFQEPEHVWIGTVREHPADMARRALEVGQ
jgi:hypothetical protein